MKNIARIKHLIQPKKIAISILLGWMGFAGSFYSLNFSNPPFSISITWSYFLPLLAGMVYGWRYGLIAGVLGGGGLFPFFLWPNNGWANFVISGLLILWYCWHGYFQECRQAKPAMWNHPLLIHLPYAVIYALAFRILYPIAFSYNPPFWNLQAELSMPFSVLEGIITKGVIMMYIIIVFDTYILKVPIIRRIFQLEIPKESRQNSGIAVGSFLGSVATWCIFVVFNRIFVDQTFPHGLTQFTDSHEIIALIVCISAGLFFGSIVTQYAEYRIRAEDKLSESEEIFRLLAENSTDMISRHTPDGVYLYVSPASERLIGYMPYELIGRSAFDFIHPDDISAVEQSHKTILGGQVIFTVAYRVQRKDGNPIWLETTSRAITDSQTGNVVEIQASSRDINERKHAEELLRLNEARYRQAITAAGAVPYYRDYQNEPHAYTFIGEDILQLTGYSAEEITPSIFDQLEQECIMRGPLARLTPDEAGRLSESGEIQQWVCDYRILARDGQTRWVSDSAIQIRDASNRRLGVIGILQDITERKRAEEILSRRANEFSALYETASEIAGQIELSELLNTVTARIATLLDVRGGGMWLYDDERDELRVVASTRQMIAVGSTLKMGEGMAGRVAPSRQPMIVDNYSQWEHRADQYEESPFAAVVEAPMLYRGALIGVLAAYEIDDNARRFTEEDARLLSLLANVVAGVIHNARDVAERNQAEMVRAATYKIAQAAVSTESLDELYAAIHNILREFLPVENFYIALYDTVNHLISFPYFVDQYNQLTATVRKYGHGLTEYVLRTGKSLLATPEIFSQLVEQGEVEFIGSVDSTDWLGIPLKVEGQVIGMMATQRYSETIRFNQGELELLEFVSTQAAQAIQRKRSEEALRESEGSLLMAQEMAKLGSWTLDARTNAITASDELLRILNLSPEEATLDNFARVIYPDDLEFAMQAINLGIAHGREYDIEYRLKLRDGTVKWIHTTGKPQLDDTGKVTKLYGTTQDITERKQAGNALQRRLIELEAVNRISTTLRTAQTSDEILPLLLDKTLSALGCEVGSIWLYRAEDEELRIVAARGWFEEFMDAPLKPGEGIAGTVFSSGTMYISREFASDANASRSLVELIPPQWGGVCAPIHSADEIAGVIFIALMLPREITAEQTTLLNSLTEMAGTALHRLRLHEETNRRLEYLDALRIIDQAITTSLDSRVTINVLLDQITAKLHVDSAGVLLFDAYSSALEYAGGCGFRSRLYERSNMRLGEGLAGRAALDRELIQSSNLLEDARLTDTALVKEEKFQAYFALPLIAKGELMGVLEIFHRAPLHPDAEWLGFLASLAGQAAIAIDNFRLFEDLQRSNIELRLAYDATIEGWAQALELRDQETEGHTRRVVQETIRLARSLGINTAELENIRRGALLHDIGKMGIPDAILLKPGKLTESERKTMRFHPEYAHKFLSSVDYLKHALDIPYCHHEKWDGTGYPRGLKGDEIPVAARIFAIVDVWDALINDRPYRPRWSNEKALEYIRAQSGKHFDPSVVDAFLNLIERQSAAE